MSIASEILRIQQAKQAIKESINDKGGTLTNESIDDYAQAIDNLPSGGGGGSSLLFTDDLELAKQANEIYNLSLDASSLNDAWANYKETQEIIGQTSLTWEDDVYVPMLSDVFQFNFNIGTGTGSELENVFLYLSSFEEENVDIQNSIQLNPNPEFDNSIYTISTNLGVLMDLGFNVFAIGDYDMPLFLMDVSDFGLSGGVSILIPSIINKFDGIRFKKGYSDKTKGLIFNTGGLYDMIALDAMVYNMPLVFGDRVIEIGDPTGASGILLFYSLIGLYKPIILPPNVKRVYGSFSKLDNVPYAEIQSDTEIDIDHDSFSQSTYPIYVPDNLVNDYKSSNPSLATRIFSINDKP